MSSSNRRQSAQLQYLLEQGSREALLKGIHWSWGIGLILALFLLFWVEVMQGAHLLVDGALIWGLHQHCWILLVVQLSQPLIWWLSRSLELKKWRQLVLSLAIFWGLLWGNIIYAIFMSDRVGSNNIDVTISAILLLVGLISLYPMRRALYGFCLPILLVMASKMWFSVVAFPLLYCIGLLTLGIMLETGRRMLKGWFMLAIQREYEQQLLVQQLDALAHQDPLTGLANRRHFDEVCKRGITQGVLLEMPLSVILLDVDFFKGYNDRYGHQAGDDCLILVADSLRDSVREPGDLVARYGGEEFVVLLAETDANGALLVAERIRANLAKQALVHEGSDVAPYLTLSQGIAQWQGGQTLNMLLERADGALYRVKEQGRDGYSVAP